MNELWAESHVTQFKSCPCGSNGITGSGTVGLVVGSHYTPYPVFGTPPLLAPQNKKSERLTGRFIQSVLSRIE